MTDPRHVSLSEFNRITAKLDDSRELREADTSRMTLEEKVEHQLAIEEAMGRARGS